MGHYEKRAEEFFFLLFDFSHRFGGVPGLLGEMPYIQTPLNKK